MFKTPKEPMTEAEIRPTWAYLVGQERAMRRNVLICRIIQPLGAVIFSLNLLLVSMNFWLFLAGDKIGDYFQKLPLLPSMVESMPQDGWSKVILFSIMLAYVLPLAICGLVACVFYLTNWLKFRDVQEPLNGTPTQCARALTNKAETVYELRKRMPCWSIYPETGILTAVTAVLVVLMFIDYASNGAMALQLVLIAMALLVCLFVLFWVYALLMYIFARINSLFYFSPSAWKFYELYHRVDAYWETIDPVEFEKRQVRAENRR